MGAPRKQEVKCASPDCENMTRFKWCKFCAKSNRQNSQRQSKHRERNDCRMKAVAVTCKCPRCEKLHLVEFARPQKIMPRISCAECLPAFTFDNLDTYPIDIGYPGQHRGCGE